MFSIHNYKVLITGGSKDRGKATMALSLIAMYLLGNKNRNGFISFVIAMVFGPFKVLP